tara:strand:- start:11 stop:508 length:498 start_codon:yes stop_codon:yes gene_type:complete
MIQKLPFHVSYQSYIVPIFLTCFFASLTSVIAIYYNNLAIERKKYNLENCKKKKSISCNYNDNHHVWIGYTSLFLRTILISFILAYGLNILFGFEPGKIIKYYNPRYEDLKHFVYIIIALVVLIFIVLFTLISMKRNSIDLNSIPITFYTIPYFFGYGKRYNPPK